MSSTALDRNFSRFLLAIAIAGIIPCLYYGNYQMIGFDGWWHLFIATQDRWMILLSDWKFEAHPLLHYLFLRYLAVLGHGHLILRSVSIVSGAIASYVIGIVAAKIYRHKISALLLAAAYTFTWNM